MNSLVKNILSSVVAVMLMCSISLFAGCDLGKKDNNESGDNVDQDSFNQVVLTNFKTIFVNYPEIDAGGSDEDYVAFKAENDSYIGYIRESLKKNPILDKAYSLKFATNFSGESDFDYKIKFNYQKEDKYTCYILKTIKYASENPEESATYDYILTKYSFNYEYKNFKSFEKSMYNTADAESSILIFDKGKTDNTRWTSRVLDMNESASHQAIINSLKKEAIAATITINN